MRQKLRESYPIEGELLKHEYAGDGNGFIVIENRTQKVIALSYADDGKTVINLRNKPTFKPNGKKTDDAGKVFCESHSSTFIRCNFQNNLALLH